MSVEENVCCICMQSSPELQSIVSIDTESLTYCDKLKVCIPNEIWLDGFHICNCCTEKLRSAYEFVQICIKSEEFRKAKLRLLQDHTNEGVINQQSFICDNCGRSFNLKRYLKLHITRKHSNRAKNKKSTEADAVIKECIESDPKQENNIVEFKEEDIDEQELNILLKEEINDKENNSDNNIPIIVSHKKEEDLSNNDDDEVEGSDLEYTHFHGETKSYSSDSDKEVKPKKRGPKLRGPLKCVYCDALFNKKQLWASHIRSKHTFEKPFACDMCDARYMNSYSLLIHKRKHSNEKPFICASCGKSFVSSADLNHHQKTHNIIRNYPCTQCDRSFKTHSNLRTHRLQMHLDPAEWKFICTVCDKKFPIRGNLVKHLKRHAGIKDFPCHICDKKFINRAELGLHFNSHTNERMFKCTMCVKEYKNREGLRRHMKVVHDVGNWKPTKPEKKYMCPMCPKIFAFTNKLQRHIFTHTGEKPFKCDYCPKKFIDNYSRKVHLRKDHNMEYK